MMDRQNEWAGGRTRATSRALATSFPSLGTTAALSTAPSKPNRALALQNTIGAWQMWLPSCCSWYDHNAALKTLISCRHVLSGKSISEDDELFNSKTYNSANMTAIVTPFWAGPYRVQRRRKEALKQPRTSNARNEINLRALAAIAFKVLWFFPTWNRATSTASIPAQSIKRRTDHVLLLPLTTVTHSFF